LITNINREVSRELDRQSMSSVGSS
jgi:hypothetical protein